MTVSTKAAPKKVEIVLVGRKSQYIANLGILRRGKPFEVSAKVAEDFLAANNPATDKPLFVTKEVFEAQNKRAQKKQSGFSVSKEEATIGGGVEEV